MSLSDVAYVTIDEADQMADLATGGLTISQGAIDFLRQQFASGSASGGSASGPPPRRAARDDSRPGEGPCPPG